MYDLHDLELNFVHKRFIGAIGGFIGGGPGGALAGFIGGVVVPEVRSLLCSRVRRRS